MKATRAVTPSAYQIPEAVAFRAISRWTFQAPTGCHISTYSTGSHGYAQIGWKVAPGKSAMTTAHRAAWTAIYGAIPPGMTIDHTCKTKQCVNVQHMRLLTPYENSRRGAHRDWRLGECARGHPQSMARQLPGGKVICDPCVNASRARYLARKRGVAA